MKIPMPKPRAVTAAAGHPEPDPLQMDRRRKAWELGASGDYAAAEAAWRDMLAARYDDGDAAVELGRVLVAQDKHGEAIKAFERGLEFGADPIATRLELGQALLAEKKYPDARVNFDEVLARSPDHLDALVGLAAALRALKQFEAALATAAHAASLRPDSADAAFAHGEALRELAREDDAVVHLRKALELKPDHRGAGMAFAALMRKLKRPREALAPMRQLVEHHPNAHDCLLALASVLMDLRDYADASKYYRRALAIRPTDAGAYMTLGQCLMGLGRIDEAIDATQQALAIEPWSRGARFGLGLMYLALGHFDEGWPLYEYRFQGEMKPVRDDILAAPWCGEDLAGKSILVIGEQANGDYFQFIRYVGPLARTAGAEVTFFGPKRLQRLLASAAPSARYATDLPPDRRYDYQVYSGSLPGLFHKLRWPIPPTPYLFVEPGLVDRWRSTIGATGVKIGIAWQGSVYTGPHAERPFRLEHLLPVARVPGVRLISLQIGTGQEQLEAMPPGMEVETLGPDFDAGEDGFIDTAAAIMNLDLVITCDTSIAHLAGALGKPVWLALNEAPEWRWGRSGSRTAWYANMRLFRQKTRGDWDGVFEEMAAALRFQMHPEAMPGNGHEATGAPAPMVPVSWGECLDKITILEIKARKATGAEAAANVSAELEALKGTLAQLGPLTGSLEELVGRLRIVNESLWTVEDDLRECEGRERFDARFVELARSVYRLNDERARIKRAINSATNSSIVEEKIYSIGRTATDQIVAVVEGPGAVVVVPPDVV
jgi:tetratricopeptide (TPR) repeat protein